MAYRQGMGAATWLACAVVIAATTARAQDADEAKLYEAAKAEGTVSWYTSTPPATTTPIIAAFEKKYPGVKVQALSVVGMQQYQRFLQESQAGQNIADVLTNSERKPIDELANTHKFLAEWKPPAAGRYDAAFRVGDYAISTSILVNTVAYNADKVTPEEVELLKTWKGILDPRFKGRISTTELRCSACYTAQFMFLDPKLAGEYGWSFLEAVAAQKPAVYNHPVLALDRIAVGEQHISIWPAESLTMALYLKGANIRWLTPSPTPYTPGTWTAISSKAAHPNAARLFANWMVSEEGALAQQASGVVTSMNGVPDRRSVTKESWFTPSTQKYIVSGEQYQRYYSDYDKDMARWARILK